MDTYLQLVLAASVTTVGILSAAVVVQARANARLRQALDLTTRAVGREHAAAEILRAELANLAATAQVRNLWLARNAEMEPWLS